MNKTQNNVERIAKWVLTAQNETQVLQISRVLHLFKVHTETVIVSWHVYVSFVLFH